MRNFWHGFLVLSLIVCLPVDTAQAAAKKKPVKFEQTDFGRWLAKLRADAAKRKKPVKGARRSGTTTPQKVAPVMPMMKTPEMIRLTGGGSAEAEALAQRVEALQNGTVAAGTTSMTYANEAATAVTPSEPVATVEEAQNAYFGKDCKANETDALMCMTCIVYFGSKFKTYQTDKYIEGSLEVNDGEIGGLKQALPEEQVAIAVAGEIQTAGTDACSELRAEKMNRFEDGVYRVFPWIEDSANVDTTMTNGERLATSQDIALKVLQAMGLTGF